MTLKKNTYITLLTLTSVIAIGSSGYIAGSTYLDNQTKATTFKTQTFTSMPETLRDNVPTKAQYNVTLVHKTGCRHCVDARATILKELSKHPNADVTFNEVYAQSYTGQQLLTQFNAQTVPLIVVSNEKANKVTALNDSSAPSIRQLLNTTAFK